MKISAILVLTVMVFLCSADGNAQKMSKNVKVKLIFDNNEVVISMYDNSASRELLKHLPMTLKFQDYAGKEKISYFPQKLSLQNAPVGAIPLTGEVAIYVPWGNLAIFYKDHSNSKDSSLVPIGKIESGLEVLTKIKSDFSAGLERAN